jgi:hypothetical protein
MCNNEGLIFMRVIEIEATVTLSQNFWARVPDDMSDDAILDAVQKGLDVGVIILDASASEELSDITHEVTADGQVNLLDDAFRFRWEAEYER